MGKKQGTVKWYNADKGFGFIVPDQAGSDVFVHVTAVQKAGLQGLKDGQRVAFNTKEERGKTAACDLETIN